MLLKEAILLTPGIYFVHWKQGGGSVAAIGVDDAGIPWIAPTNWVRPVHRKDHGSAMLRETWDMVASVEHLTNQLIEMQIREMVT